VCNAVWSFSTVNGGGRLIANLLAVVPLVAIVDPENWTTG
jgi:hypothetical protein